MELLLRFVRDERGIALTEYLMLLGLLIAGVIVAIPSVGAAIALAYGSWGGFWSSISDAPSP